MATNNVLSIFDTVSAAEKGAQLFLLHPVTKEKVYADAKQEKPLSITLKGLDSGDFEREIQRRQRMAKNRKSDEVDLEKAKLEAAETYARLTIGWENIPGFEEFSFENAVKLYLTYKDIRVQVGDFIADKSNFIKA